MRKFSKTIFKFKNLTFFLILSAFFLGGIKQVSAQKKVDDTPNFTEFIKAKLEKTYKIKLSQICPIDTNTAAKRVFADYGAIFVSNNGGKLPARCIFEDETQVTTFQSGANPQTENIGGTTITLQKSAMEALLEARKEAAKKGLNITPRGGSISGSRSFEDTYRLWNSRFFPALDYWVKRGKILRSDAEEAKKLPISQQVAKVLEWEDKGFYFSTGFDKSILYSVAAPGASQHIFMLALDVSQFGDKRVREILADHGWFQTVQSDLPHFTYIGVKENELPSLGLKSVTVSGHKFWIPNV
jgi:hypothetical protein